MKGAAFGIILSLIPLSSMAADCFDMAGRDYKIDPDLLRAISWQESRFKIDAIGRNPVTGYGSGLMQIDSQHFNELSRYGIKPDHLLSDACLKEGANKQVISSQADSLIKISRIWADFFPANTSNQPI